MSAYHDVLNAIPMLRRYAFCLTGSREAGDGWIERTLRDMLERRLPLQGSSVTVSLFKIFNATCSVAGTFGYLRGNSDSPEQALHAKVLALPLPQRRALLLVHSMQFTDTQAAEILDLPIEEVRRLRHSARAMIARDPRPASLAKDPDGAATMPTAP